MSRLLLETEPRSRSPNLVPPPRSRPTPISPRNRKKDRAVPSKELFLSSLFKHSDAAALLVSESQLAQALPLQRPSSKQSRSGCNGCNVDISQSSSVLRAKTGIKLDGLKLPSETRSQGMHGSCSCCRTRQPYNILCSCPRISSNLTQCLQVDPSASPPCRNPLP